MTGKAWKMAEIPKNHAVMRSKRTGLPLSTGISV